MGKRTEGTGLTLSHETILQKLIATGIAVNYLARTCPDKYKHCKQTLEGTNELIEIFRALPKEKKDLLNRILA